MQSLAKLAGPVKLQAPETAELSKNPVAMAEQPKDDGVKRKHFPAGAYIFRQGDPGDEAYLVDDGQVDIVIGSNAEECGIAVVERGYIFGEMAPIDKKPRMASARGRTDTTLAVIPEEEFRAQLAKIAEVDRMMLLLFNQFVGRPRDSAR